MQKILLKPARNDSPAKFGLERILLISRPTAWHGQRAQVKKFWQKMRAGRNSSRAKEGRKDPHVMFCFVFLLLLRRRRKGTWPPVQGRVKWRGFWHWWGYFHLPGILLRVSFCTRHMPNDSQSQSTFAASQSKDMLKYDQPVKKPMMYKLAVTWNVGSFVSHQMPSFR